MRSGGCKRIVHFASTFCKELRRIGAGSRSYPDVGNGSLRPLMRPSNSRQWQDAAGELSVISAECLRRAKLTGDEALIAEAERTAAILP